MIVRLRRSQVLLSSSGQCLSATGRRWRPSRSLATPSKRFLSLPVKPEEVDFENGELYNYTSRRFLINGKDELAKRRVRFDVNASGAVAARYAGPEGTAVVNIEKVLESTYNKTYMIQFDSGAKIMVKVFNSDEHKFKATTFSEIGTMKFTRCFTNVPGFPYEHLELKTEGNEVAAPWMLTRVPKGVPLGSVWSRMNSLEQQKMMKAIMTYIIRWTHFEYPGYGDICRRDSRRTEATHLPIDLDIATTKVGRYSSGREGQWYGTYRTVNEFQKELSKMAIGPALTRFKETVPNHLRFGKHSTGPWKTSDHYLKNVAAFTMARRDTTKSGRNLHSMMIAARLYHTILPYITPEDDGLLRPALWKPNMTADTIYVDPDSSYQIKGILDWRYAEVVPGYRQVNQPPFINMYGDAGSSSVPETIHDLYVRLVSDVHPHVVMALQFKKTTEWGLLESVHDITKDNGISFLTRAIEYIQTERPDIVEMLEDDSELSTTKLSEKFKQQIAFHRRKEDILEEVRTELGDLVAEDWTVRPEDYDTAKMILASAKESLCEHTSKDGSGTKEWEKLWPFDD
ncbi:hypothetical protein KCU65_g5742, partial [Aureobasidium melanogenum]